jgi:hypothetical protein
MQYLKDMARSKSHSSDAASEGDAAEEEAGNRGKTSLPFTRAKYDEMFALKVRFTCDTLVFLIILYINLTYL